MLGLTITTAGNANGAACAFPFTYIGVSYSKCINTNNNGVLWCATTTNYDTDKKWGHCVTTGTGGPTPPPGLPAATIRLFLVNIRN